MARVCSGWKRRQDGEKLHSPPGMSVSTGVYQWVLGPVDLALHCGVVVEGREGVPFPRMLPLSAPEAIKADRKSQCRHVGHHL